MNDKTRIIFSWVVVLVTFLIIAVLCIGFIFAPVKEYYKDRVTQETTVYSWYVAGDNGGLEIATSWKEYPHYTAGLGIAAIVSFSGAAFSFYMIEKLRGDKPDL